MSRISPLVNDILGTEDADDLMIEIMDVLGDSIASTPEVGKIYVFVYQPKTQGLRYDQNPLVKQSQIYMSGDFVESTFIGVNLVHIPSKK